MPKRFFRINVDTDGLHNLINDKIEISSVLVSKIKNRTCKISDKVSSNSVSRNVNNQSNNSVQMCKNKRKNGLRSSDVNNKNRFSENTKNHEKMIKFIYTNIRSIKTKFDEFKTLVNTENPDIIGLTETWLNCTKMNLKVNSI